ncbi:hypothetical protein [Aureivirga sp. CE67]|uniref:hypothetical protein n=1 Tax=Aureivirga sp. CE67 TaxID=1788983 RepID=UPI0018CAC88C|nr:hypothetical protein [Aureivirga sp. CE67]
MSILLFLHSINRWLVLLFLLISIYLSLSGYFKKRNFNKTDNLFRHWTATVTHIQLILGIILYVKNPLILNFWKNNSEINSSYNFSFFAIYHSLFMFLAIIFISIGSAKAKRQLENIQKFKTMLIWFSISIIIIIAAIPWPFYKSIGRVLFRTI